ncbi:PucR family transcriptional regulator [Streptomyces sp. NPDC001380]|uniref:PucR family transcriptional regulator n=1 Tax=Streptomyces sp. NPDC001380 TaxID=3364566 RepID=UPI00369E5479
MGGRLHDDADGGACITSLVDRLLAGVDALAAELTAQLLDRDRPFPKDASPDREELHGATLDNLRAVLGALRGEFPVILDAPRRAGRAKARQGIPLEALLQVYRLTGRFIWDRLLDLALDEGRSAVLLHKASEVWTVIDQCSSAAAESYQATVQERVGRDVAARSLMLATLLDGTAESGVGAWDILRAMQLDLGGPFLVVLSEGVGGADPLPGVEDRLRGAGIGSGWIQQMDAQVGLLALPGDQAVTPAHGHLDAAARGRIGISRPFTSPAQAPTARRQARLAAHCIPPGTSGTHVYGTSPVGLLAAASPDTAAEVARTVLGPLLGLPAGERAALLGTLDAWFAEGGSTARAAERLHCHRNTVLYRLNRIGELTGRSTAAAGSCAELYIALHTMRLSGTGA